jgi:hypothetical protein
LLILQPGLQTTNKSVKIQYLESALSKDLRALLVTIDAADNVKEYQIKIANMEEQAHRLQSTPSHPNPAAAAPTSNNHNDAMNWEPTPSQINTIQRGRGQRGGRGGNRGGSLGIENASKQRTKRVLKEELQKRRVDGRCMRCGSSDHFQNDCSFGLPICPTPVVAARKTHPAQGDTYYAPEVEDTPDNAQQGNAELWA